VTDAEARRFWDRRAEEDAFFAVDDRLELGNPNVERFWSEGARDLETLLEIGGATIGPSDAIVEIGCGIGRLTRVIAERAGSVRAIDVSARMLELAREHNPGLDNVDWLLGDGTSLAGVESGSADGVLSHVVFQHIPDPAITLDYVREMGRVLRSGGWAVFGVSNDPTVHRPRGRAGRLRTVLRARLRPDDRWHEKPHWMGSHVELPALRAAAADGGMEVEQVSGEGTQYCVVRTRRA
jgi:SAM-dependent methyltransferase